MEDRPLNGWNDYRHRSSGTGNHSPEEWTDLIYTSDITNRPTEEQKKAILSRVEEVRKYFTPEISDIRIGYECEIWWNWNMLPENEWCPIVIGDNNTKDFDFIDFTSRIPKNEIRTLYLTKEQIENEGWKLQENGKFLKFSGIYDLENDLTGSEFLLSVNFDIHRIWIEKGEISYAKAYYPYEGSNHLFQGECKDINTLRYISKLLGI